jgi:hypothetical protein
MEHTPARELIQQMKIVKSRDEITYPRIIEMLEKNGHFVSMTTLRRVFAEGSEDVNFNYETTLLPIAQVLLGLDGGGNSAMEDASGLRAVIRLQTEEIERLHELNDHLEDRVTFLIGQIEKKDRRMDEKDEIIRKLLEKCL